MKKLLFTIALLISFSSFGQDFNEDLIGSVWKLQFKEWSSHNSFVYLLGDDGNFVYMSTPDGNIYGELSSNESNTNRSWSKTNNKIVFNHKGSIMTGTINNNTNFISGIGVDRGNGNTWEWEAIRIKTN